MHPRATVDKQMRVTLVFACVVLSVMGPAPSFGSFIPQPPLVDRIGAAKMVVVAKCVSFRPKNVDAYDRYRELTEQRSELYEHIHFLYETDPLVSSPLLDVAAGWLGHPSKSYLQKLLCPRFKALVTQLGQLNSQSNALPPDRNIGTSALQIQWIRKGPANLWPGQSIVLSDREPLVPGEFILLAGYTALHGVDWQVELTGREPVLEYARELPDTEAPRLERLASLFQFMGSRSEAVSSDASHDFRWMNATTDELDQLARMLPVEELRQQFAESDDYTADTCAELLGFVGGEADAERLLHRFWSEPQTEWSYATELTSYLRIRRERGLDELDARFASVARKQRSLKEFYLCELQRLWTEPIPGISRERLKRSMRLLASDPRFVANALHTLAEWGDWSLVDQVAHRYGADDFDSLAIRRAIVSYLVCSCADFSSLQRRRFPTHAFRAITWLYDLRARDRRTYRYAGYYLASLVPEDLEERVEIVQSLYRAFHGAKRPIDELLADELSDSLDSLLQSPEARAIEKNLGYD